MSRLEAVAGACEGASGVSSLGSGLTSTSSLLTCSGACHLSPLGPCKHCQHHSWLYWLGKSAAGLVWTTGLQVQNIGSLALSKPKRQGSNEQQLYNAIMVMVILAKLQSQEDNRGAVKHNVSEVKHTAGNSMCRSQLFWR